MTQLDLLKIIDRIFILKPEEQKIIKKEIERIQSEAKNDKDKS